MMKKVSSPGYNYAFDDKTGFFARWGKTLDDDPQFSPLGTEIADIEVTTICTGPGGRLCKFCYKANTPNGKNMSFETFKEVFARLPKNLTQIAFGADASCTSNPDIWKMFDYCRNNDINPVIPNITVATITDETAQRLAAVCGAVAVSRYDDKNLCYDSVKRLSDAGLDQVNIHQMLSRQTFQNAMDTIDDAQTDERLKGLRAIVFLSLKQKGRGERFTPLTEAEFKMIVDKALDKGVAIGFDSCSANKFLKAVKDNPRYEQFAKMTEPCESTCFSVYIDVDGEFYPCSFTPGCKDWDTGIDVTKVDDFMTEVWFDERTCTFRKSLVDNRDENGLRQCPLYEV